MKNSKQYSIKYYITLIKHLNVNQLYAKIRKEVDENDQLESMQKPNYKALEKQIKSLKGNIKGLNESKNDFNALIYNIPKMFKIIELIYDESGKAIDYYFREINKKFMLFTNLSKSQLINKRYREVIGEIPDEWLICYSEILKTNISVSGIILNSPENMKFLRGK